MANLATTAGMVKLITREKLAKLSYLYQTLQIHCCHFGGRDLLYLMRIFLHVCLLKNVVKEFYVHTCVKF